MMYSGYILLCHTSSAYLVRELLLVHIIIIKESEISIVVILIYLVFIVFFVYLFIRNGMVYCNYVFKEKIEVWVLPLGMD